MSRVPKVVVIGAGIGGLTTAALLAKAGLDVTVLEAHVYPGGCAGTFYHQNYRFDAGATVAGGFYPGGPMDLLARQIGVNDWQAHPAQVAMSVHLPAQGAQRAPEPIYRFGDERRWDQHRTAFGPESLKFWEWQEQTADLFWDLALRLPPWPPQSPHELGRLVQRGAQWGLSNWRKTLNPKLAKQAFSTARDKLTGLGERLRLFVDGQLLIAAQATSHAANALYAASALDLPRRGIVHFDGGMGAMADRLVEAVRGFGGEVLFRSQATSIIMEGNRPIAVRTKRNQEFDADLVVANLTPWNIARLLGDGAPSALDKLTPEPEQGWGAFMLYAGVDSSVIEANEPLHHQVIVREPLGEGNSVFVSVSPAHDAARAPLGKRAVTISTHTAMKPWWTLHAQDVSRYEQRRAAYTQRILQAAERAIPELGEAADLLLPGTPVTFNRFTRRSMGWVGGFPQTSLFQAWGPSIGKNLWMVGDSIFPGQSTAAVALGGMRVADSILAELGSVPVVGAENAPVGMNP